MLRKPGGYRKPTPEMENRSRIPREDYFKWFAPVWADVPGASPRAHPAPFPLEIPSRLIRMFSFVGDTVADPFSGTGTTSVAALMAGRNSIGYEVEPAYLALTKKRSPRSSLPT